MLTQNFGAAASLQAFGSINFGAQQPAAHNCSCGTVGHQPQGYPQAMPQQQASAQFQMQMMMGYFMNMMASMSQLQQGFGSFLGQGQQQIANPYQQQPVGGGYGGGGYAGGGYGGGGGYPTPAPAPVVAPKPAPAPAPPAKKGGYA